MEVAEPLNGGSVKIQTQNHSRKLPNFLQSVNIKYVKLGYHYLITNLFKLCLIPLMAVLITQISRLTPQDLYQIYLHLQYNLVAFILLSALAVFGSTVFIMSRPRSVFLIDYSCYLPPVDLQVKYQKFMDHSKLIEDFNDSSLEFQRKILERSGLGEETYLPEALHCIPPRPNMATAREEAEQVIRDGYRGVWVDVSNRWDRLQVTISLRPLRCGYGNGY